MLPLAVVLPPCPSGHGSPFYAHLTSDGVEARRTAEAPGPRSAHAHRQDGGHPAGGSTCAGEGGQIEGDVRRGMQDRVPSQAPLPVTSPSSAPTSGLLTLGHPCPSWPLLCPRPLHAGSPRGTHGAEPGLAQGHSSIRKKPWPPPSPGPLGGGRSAPAEGANCPCKSINQGLAEGGGCR